MFNNPFTDTKYLPLTSPSQTSSVATTTISPNRRLIINPSESPSSFTEIGNYSGTPAGLFTVQSPSSSPTSASTRSTSPPSVTRNDSISISNTPKASSDPRSFSLDSLSKAPVPSFHNVYENEDPFYGTYQPINIFQDTKTKPHSSSSPSSSSSSSSPTFTSATTTTTTATNSVHRLTLPASKVSRSTSVNEFEAIEPEENPAPLPEGPYEPVSNPSAIEDTTDVELYDYFRNLTREQANQFLDENFNVPHLFRYCSSDPSCDFVLTYRRNGAICHRKIFRWTSNTLQGLGLHADPRQCTVHRTIRDLLLAITQKDLELERTNSKGSD